MVLLKTLGFALFLYAALVGLIALLQGPMLFPRAMVAPAPALPETAERLEVTHQGATLHGVRIPGRDPGLPLLLGFGGNAWNAEDVALFLQRIAPDHPVAAFHYRGYAPSTGRPSSRALMADSEAIFDQLDADKVVAVGFSIGSGVAAHLARTRPLQGAVLVTPFDSLAAVARQSFPWAPVRLLFRHDMPALEALTATPAPVALIIAARDTIIPPARAHALAEGLAAADRAPRRVETLQAGHNDIYGHPDFAPALRTAIAAVIE